MKAHFLSIGIVITIAVIGGAIAVYVIFFAPSSVASFSCSSLTTKPVIVAFGDSLVAGYGAPEQQGFVGPLSTRIGVPISNAGVNGNTTAEALARVPDVLAQHPDIVILLIGGNDALQQVPLATTQSNLTQILSIFQQQHIRVVLVGVRGGLFSDPYAPPFKSLAATYADTYVPDILAGLLGNQTYMYDQVHPNAAGYDKAALKIYPALDKSCQNFSKGT
jgi:acyl-CoA thioesterase-1